jgi:hypothetical protein
MNHFLKCLHPDLLDVNGLAHVEGVKTISTDSCSNILALQREEIDIKLMPLLMESFYLNTVNVE